MQLGFVTAVFADQPLEPVLAFAGREGYRCVEVQCWPAGGKLHGGVTHLDVDGFTQAKADDVLALCEKYHVGISALGYYPNPLSADADEAERARTHIRKVIDAAPLLGLDIVNSFVGASTKLPLVDNFRRFAEVWPDLVRYAEDGGVRIAIENCPMLFRDTWPFGKNLARTPAIWRRMFETIPSKNFGLNYDPSHLRMQLIDPIAPIREFGPRIFHTHAKDMRVDADRLQSIGSLEPPMERSTAKIPGLGDIHWGHFIGALSDAHYNGAVCVEVEDEAFTHTLAGRERSLRISRNVLQPLIA
jgi:sugar phosphate isomerase/epimerase